MLSKNWTNWFSIEIIVQCLKIFTSYNLLTLRVQVSTLIRKHKKNCIAIAMYEHAL
jgi:hypothetical protein